jgi:enolase-phosphatase E1
MSTAKAETLPKVYLLDVEGTTSPVSLVSEQLFPYARRHLAEFLRARGGSPEIEADLRLLESEYRVDEEAKQILRFAQDDKSLGRDISQETGGRFLGEAGRDAALAYLNWLMDRDRKSTALKSLQGQIWKAGFEAGELVGTVFPDVPLALARWSRRAKVAIYSSGSVEAQQLLFRYSSAGDLTPYLSAYFDTRVGAKTSAESYRAIAATLDVKIDEILFLSDVLRELDPAREAGCRTCLSLREGNASVIDGHGHPAIRTFAEMG